MRGLVGIVGLMVALVAAGGCGEEAARSTPDRPAPPSAPPPVEDVAPAEPEDVASEPATAIWSPAAVPDEIVGAKAVRAVMERLGAEGFAADLVDDTHGVYVVRDGEPGKWLDGEALAVATQELRDALRSDAAIDCDGSVCIVRAGGAWVVQTRLAADGKRRVAGALRVGTTSLTPRYHEWFVTTRDAWLEKTYNLMGEALSAEESGKLELALRSLSTALELDPESPWPLLHRARIHAELGHFEEAYLDLRVLATRNSPSAMSAMVRAAVDPGLAKLREHTALDAVLAEARMTAPVDPDHFVAYLRRFRAAPTRLRAAIADEAVEWDALSRVLETYLLFEPRVDAEALTVTWDDPSADQVRLTLLRDERGALKVGKITTISVE